MVRLSESEVKPRNGNTLVVGIVCRISGCSKQTDLSLEDQEDNCKGAVKELYDGPVEFETISTKGKGERLDRPELEKIETLYRSERFDIFAYDDLSRLIRGGEAARLLGVGVDHGTRSICIDDGIDTADITWEEDALNACSENVAHNQRTSKRLKQKLMNRFKKAGRSRARLIAGYIEPEGAASYDDLLKDPKAESWLCEGDGLSYVTQHCPDMVDKLKQIGWVRAGADLLRETQNYSAVGDFLNRIGIPVGPYCRRKDWDGRMVRRFFANRLLMGKAGRGFRHSVKHFESGRRKSVPNPKGPTFYECLHLAFFTSDEFEELQTSLKERNARYKRKPVNGTDPLLKVPRKRTRFPGQFGCCWYCGRQHVWGGNGITDNLMCSGARQWNCWNSVGYDGRLAVTALVDWITVELYRLDRFEDQYRELVEVSHNSGRSDVTRRRERLRNDELSLELKKSNLKSAILEYGTKPMFKGLFDEIEAAERKLKAEGRTLDRIGDNRLQVPASLVELRSLFVEEFTRGMLDSPQFGDFLRKIVLDFRVYLVRLCDGGHLLPRARVKVALDRVVADAALIPGVEEILYREFTIDLFKPPQRERIREASVGLAARGLGPKAIAAKIVDVGDNHPTTTAVQNALDLDRLMKQMGLTTPYVAITEPPEDYSKLRRHKNAKYRFTPLEGYVPPTL